MKDVFITYAKRTPIGKLRGGLSSVRADDLLAQVFIDFKSQCNFDLEEIDEIMVGCANQSGEDNRNVARMSAVLAGIPFSVPGVTLNRLCASSLDALLGAYCRIQGGIAEGVLVGGVESMSRAPYVLSKADRTYSNAQKMYDTSLGWRFPNPKMEQIFPLWNMGLTAENLATIYEIGREEQDHYALFSHKKALAADFSNEIVSIERNKLDPLFIDEGPRKNSTLEKLSKLKPVFSESGSVTAGNASSLNDGAAALFIASEKFIKRHNLTPLVRIEGGSTAGVHPNEMGIGPVASTLKYFQKSGQSLNDYFSLEINEAFAVQVLSCVSEFGITEKFNENPLYVNPKGGAIALGHPLGCSGARIATTGIHWLKEKGKKGDRSLFTMCVGVGQGVTLSVENV